jgi:hypothetical protein
MPFAFAAALAVPSWLSPQENPIAHRGTLARSDHRLTSGEFYDAYPFEGRAGERLVFDLQSSGFNPYLMLTAPSGVRRANEGWQGSRQQSRMELTLEETGTFTISVTSNQTGEMGAYELQIETGRASVAAAPTPAIPQAAAPQGPSATRQSPPIDASGLYLRSPKALQPFSTSPRWSPDGTRLLYTVCPRVGVSQRPCEIWVVNADGTNPVRVTQGRDGIWAQSGNRIAFLRRADTLVIRELNTGRETAVMSVSSWELSRWLPGDRYIVGASYYQNPPQTPSYWRVDLNTLEFDFLNELRYREVQDSILLAFSQPWATLEPNITETFCVGCGWLSAQQEEGGLRGLGTEGLGCGGLTSCSPSGLWAINRDGTYGTLLTLETRGNMDEAQLSPDRVRLAYERQTRSVYDTARVYIAQLGRRSPARDVFEIRLGRERGIVPGDVLYIRPPRINPLTKAVVGPLNEPVRAVVVVLESDSGRAVLQTLLYFSSHQPGDLAVATEKVWAELRPVAGATWTPRPPELLAALIYNSQSAHALALIHEHHGHPDIVRRLLEADVRQRDRPGLEALGRLRLREAASAVTGKLPERYGALGSGEATLVWTLGELGDRSALGPVSRFCSTVPPPDGIGVPHPEEVIRLRSVCQQVIERLGK